ncbi:MAG: hypothetical protein AB7L09_22180 [Nitrospira sp.]
MSKIARYDKYQPVAGGFRAPLAAAVTATSGAGLTNQVAVPLGVGLNSSGQVVVGAGATGIIGVLVVDSAKAAGDVVDVMTAGEIVDLDETAFDPGATYYGAAAGGVLSTTNTGRRVGFTVGDKSLTTGVITSRLIVRVAGVVTGAV